MLTFNNGQEKGANETDILIGETGGNDWLDVVSVD